MTAVACYICGNKNSDVLERHHIVPQRFDGSDEDDNIVTVCSNCHTALEKMYDKRFYDTLGVSAENGDGEKEPGMCHRQDCSARGVAEITGNVWGCETHKHCSASGCTKRATRLVRDCKGKVTGNCPEHAQCQCPGCGETNDSVFTPASNRYFIMCHTHAKMRGVAP